MNHDYSDPVFIVSILIRFAAGPVWRQDEAGAGLTCVTGAHYTREPSRLASRLADLIDKQGNLV